MGSQKEFSSIPLDIQNDILMEADLNSLSITKQNIINCVKRKMSIILSYTYQRVC